MTIRKRLYVSNMMMLVIPILLFVILVASMIFTLTQMLGINGPRSLRDGDRFYSTINYVNVLAEEIITLSDPSDVIDSVNSFNGRYASSEMFVTAYIKGASLYPESANVDSELLHMVMYQDDDIVIIRGKTAVYRVDSGETSLLLIDVNYSALDLTIIDRYYFVHIIIFIVLIAIILLINRILTQYVFKSIMTPIDTLTYGVHQIRDGNLDYRISYTGKDEFAIVCSDFNEMAERLMESVNRRMKDDTNRKELIAGISHDLRTPLTSIKAYLEGIEKGVASTPELRLKYFYIVKSKTNELEHIINQLFLFSKIDIGDFPLRLERVDIEQELSEVVCGLSDEYKDKMFSIFLRAGDVKIYADIDVQQFRNVVTNIIENSAKYKNKENGKLEISCRADNNEIIIEFTDDGPGVPDESLGKLFDVFYRCDPSRNNTASGSGLGLAIAAKVIERLGGCITAMNVEDGGLTIIIKLPLSQIGE